MIKSFKDMKKSTATEFSKLNDKLKSINEPTFNKKDDRFWSLTVDKTGNGYATIRFLPQPVDEEEVFVRFWDHGFKVNGQWYIEKSRTSLLNAEGKPEDDPCSEYNTQLWNSGQDGGPERAFVTGTRNNPGSKRRLHYVSNIYVVEDPANPSNNGKVFLFKYGKKIYDKLNDAMNPKVPINEKFNPFDFWKGANFTLIAGTDKDGYRAYNDSRFGPIGPLLDSDEEMEKIWKLEYALYEFIDPKNYKSYDDLNKRLQRVLNTTNRPKVSETVEQEPVKPAPTPKAKETPATPAAVTPPWEEDESDDDLSKFQKLAQG